MSSSSDPSPGLTKAVTIGSCVVMAIVSLLILTLVQGQDLPAIFLDKATIGLQLLSGLVAGCLLALAVLCLPGLEPLRAFARHMIGQQLNPSRTEVPVFALATAIGEELLFRALLQPIIGIWLTSLAFVVAHGGLNFKRPDLVQFNLFLFASSLLMGALFIFLGLVAAIAAHAAYNLVIMIYARRSSGAS